MTSRVVALALTVDERALLISTLMLAEELGADTSETRPLIEMLDRALDLDDQVVREALTSRSFFAESRAMA